MCPEHTTSAILSIDFNSKSIRPDERRFQGESSTQLKLINELFRPITNSDNKHSDGQQQSVNGTPRGFKGLKTYNQDLSESLRPTK